MFFFNIRNGFCYIRRLWVFSLKFKSKSPQTPSCLKSFLHSFIMTDNKRFKKADIEGQPCGDGCGVLMVFGEHRVCACCHSKDNNHGLGRRYVIRPHSLPTV